MKNNNLVYILGAVIIVSFLLFSFKSENTVKKFQYLTVYSEHYDLDDVFISIDGKEYKRIKLIKEIKGPWDMNPLINLIHQYEAEGWELVEFTANIKTFIYMKKEVQ